MQYAIKARCYTRLAWLTLGKAREARSTATYLSGTGRDVYCRVMEDYTRDMVRCARNYMRLAIMYRTEVL